MLQANFDQLIVAHGYVNQPVAPGLDLIQEINRLKKEKNAVILGHYYITGELQDISDFLGDSLALAQAAQKTEADLIVFVGVHFMGETAKILNPNKKVVVPDMNAGCSLASSAPADAFQAFKDQHPNHQLLCGDQSPIRRYCNLFECDEDCGVVSKRSALNLCARQKLRQLHQFCDWS